MNTAYTRHRQLYMLIVLSLCAAILIIAQVALAVLPNIELVSLLIVIYTLVFGRKTLAIIYVFAIAEGVIYGFGLWFINYLYIWTILWLIVMLLPKVNSAFYYASVIGVFGLCFGLLCSIPYLFIGGPGMALAYFISGISFDIPHAVGNAISALLLYHPLMFVLRRAVKA